MAASDDPGDFTSAHHVGCTARSWEIDVVSSATHILAVWGMLGDLGQTVPPPRASLFSFVTWGE